MSVRIESHEVTGCGTHHRMLFPEPATITDHESPEQKGRLGSHTFSVDPQKTTLGIPLFEGAASYEPDRRSVVIIIARNHLIFRRVWRRKPAHRFVVQTIACEASSSFGSIHSGRDIRFILFISFTTSCIVTVPIVRKNNYDQYIE